MTTPIKNIAEVANNQVNQYLTVNEALRALEAANFDIAVVDLSAGNVTLTPPVFDRAVFFRSSGNSVARDLTIPASKSLFVVHNAGTFDLTVKRGSASVVISVGSAIVLYSDGTTDGLMSIAGGSGSGGVFGTAAVSSGVIDLSAPKDVYIVNLTENVTGITLPTAVGNGVISMLILFTQDATGGRTVAGWPSAFFESGSAPAITATANSITSVPVLILGNGNIYVVG